MGDEEGYTSLHFKARKKPEDEGTGVPKADLLSPHWHRPALYISGALNILLAFAVVGFGVWILRAPKEHQHLQITPVHGGGCVHNTSTGLHQAEPEALLCPEGWQLHAGNCYYFSKYTEPKTWSESHEDCSTRGSCLLLIQNKPELNFIGNNKSHYYWIGLFNTTPERRWTWVNGSTLEQKVFLVAGPSSGDRCGTVKVNILESAPCSNELQWICQKKARRSNSKSVL